MGQPMSPQTSWRRTLFGRLATASKTLFGYLHASPQDDLLLDDFVTKLPTDGERPNCSWMYIDSRDELLRRLGKTIVRGNAPTNFVRDRLNPIVDATMRSIELQRGDQTAASDLVQITTCLISLGLEVARVVNADQKFRVGIAIDYIYLSGRLARSEEAFRRFDGAERYNDMWRADLSFCASQLAVVRAALGSALEAAMNRVLDDTMVLPAFKELLRTAQASNTGSV